MENVKMQPQSIELEKAVLGAMMLEAECVSIVMDIVREDSFYKYEHGLIFKAIKTLYNNSFPVDIRTVVEQLKKTGQLELVGGGYTVVELTNGIASSAHVEFHARIIEQKALQRRLIQIGMETSRTAHDEGADVFDLIDKLEKNITSLTSSFTTGKVLNSMQLWKQLEEKNETIKKQKGINGVPSGFTGIDEMTAGWQNSDLIILAARPSMGKTSLAVNIATNAAVDFNIPTLIFSLEMSALQLYTKMASAQSNISNNKFSRKGIEPELFIKVAEKCSKLMVAEMYIDDTPGLSLMEMRSKARKYKREKDIKLIVVDYLQLMEGDRGNKNGNREQEVSAISRGLKKLAKELDVPIIALSQLSRGTEQRGGEKKPQLSDLRESGAIEQDADVVMFVHRPEYYGIKELADGRSTKGVSEIIFAKHRNGPIGSVELYFIAYLTKFVNVEQKMEHETKPAGVIVAPPENFTESKKNTEDHPF